MSCSLQKYAVRNSHNWPFQQHGKLDFWSVFYTLVIYVNMIWAHWIIRREFYFILLIIYKLLYDFLKWKILDSYQILQILRKAKIVFCFFYFRYFWKRCYLSIMSLVCLTSIRYLWIISNTIMKQVILNKSWTQNIGQKYVLSSSKGCTGF